MKGKILTSATRLKTLNFEQLTNREFLEWMESHTTFIEANQNTAYWTRYVECWHDQRLKGEKKERIAKFLKCWATSKAANGRAAAYWSPRLEKIQRDVFEPLSMALATPDDPWFPAWANDDEPITQEAIDRRLASWLRRVIITKKTSLLTSLAEAIQRIQCRLYVGIHITEIVANINQTGLPKSQGKTRMLNEFHAFIRNNNRLPSKGTLTELAEIDNIRNAVRHRKNLGLDGLPKSQPRW
jgi:hypothetical protein